jgi:hypothetical protein
MLMCMVLDGDQKQKKMGGGREGLGAGFVFVSTAEARALPHTLCYSHLPACLQGKLLELQAAKPRRAAGGEDGVPKRRGRAKKAAVEPVPDVEAAIDAGAVSADVA